MHIDLESEREDIVKLCAWLREHSSGRYRPSADAATILELLVAEVDRLTAEGNTIKEGSSTPSPLTDTLSVDTVEGVAQHTACRRCNSYASLVKSLESRLVVHSAKASQYAEATATLESERAANHALTNEVQRLSAELTDQSRMVQMCVKTLVDAAVGAIRSAPRSILWWHPEGRPVYSPGEGAELVLRGEAVEAVQGLDVIALLADVSIPADSLEGKTHG